MRAQQVAAMYIHHIERSFIWSWKWNMSLILFAMTVRYIENKCGPRSNTVHILANKRKALNST